MEKRVAISWQVRLLLYLLNISLEGDLSGQSSFPGGLSEDVIEGLCSASGAGEFAELVERQKLAVPVYEAVIRCITETEEKGEAASAATTATDGNDALQEALRTLRNILRESYYTELMKAAAQDEDIEVVLDALDEAGIESIPLKGWVLRSMYPSRLMRSMCDFDILVRNFDGDRITAAMSGIGYRPEDFTGGKHEHYIGRSGRMVEVHRRLTERAGYVNEWEAKVWKRATRMSGCRFIYAMSPEDMVIFHLLHMEWDITHGALPLRAICDLHRFSEEQKGMDDHYLENELSRLGILCFARKMDQLTAVCFRGAAPDQDTELLLNFYMSEHMRGSPKRNALSRAALSAQKHPALGLFKSRLRSVFVPMSFMKEQFPALKKHPWLLPAYRIKRMFLMVRRYRADSYRRDYGRLSADEMKEMREVLHVAGIRKNHF